MPSPAAPSLPLMCMLQHPHRIGINASTSTTRTRPHDEANFLKMHFGFGSDLAVLLLVMQENLVTRASTAHATHTYYGLGWNGSWTLNERWWIRVVNNVVLAMTASAVQLSMQQQRALMRSRLKFNYALMRHWRQGCGFDIELFYFILICWKTFAAPS